jgi:exosortase
MADKTKNKTDWMETLGGDLRQCWRELPNKGFFFGLLAAWLALFQFLGNSTFGYVDSPSLFRWLLNAYNAPNSEDGHGILIPFVVIGLGWWKRGEWRPLAKGMWWPAMIGLAGGVLLHVAGYVFQQPRVSAIGFFLGLYSLMGLAWGASWLKVIFFPFILLIFSVPIGSLAEVVTFPMRMIVTTISTVISHDALGIDVIRDGTRLSNAQGTFQYDVAPACSGIRSLITLFALTTIYGFVVFRKTWKRFLTIGTALPLAILGNVVRITAVIVVAEAFGQDAGSFVHDWAGFVTFALALGCVMLLGAWLREDKRESP